MTRFQGFTRAELELLRDALDAVRPDYMRRINMAQRLAALVAATIAAGTYTKRPRAPRRKG